MRILVIGQGVLGNATGFSLAERGHDVLYHDPPKHIYGSPEGRDVALICVPTPMGPGGYNVRREVYKSAEWLAQENFEGLVGIRSTCIMGTCDALAQQYPQMTWFSWPEFLRDKYAKQDAVKPCRIVVGASDGPTHATLRQLAFVNNVRYIACKPTDAEFIKYATNAIHAMAVTFAGELAMIGAAHGVDWNAMVWPLAQGDPMVPDNIWVTEEGGFGGKCLPKDTAALWWRAAHELDMMPPLLTAMDKINRALRPEEYTVEDELPGEA